MLIITKMNSNKHSFHHLDFAPLRGGSVLIKIFYGIPSKSIAVVSELRLCFRLKEICHLSLECFEIHQRRIPGTTVGERKRIVIVGYMNNTLFSRRCCSMSQA